MVGILGKAKVAGSVGIKKKRKVSRKPGGKHIVLTAVLMRHIVAVVATTTTITCSPDEFQVGFEDDVERGFECN